MVYFLAGWSSGIKLLQSQLQLKKAALTQTKVIISFTYELCYHSEVLDSYYEFMKLEGSAEERCSVSTCGRFKD